MGVYSTNRIDSVAVNEDAQFLKEIEETAMDPNFGNIMESVILLHENDSKMFNSLIECDFITAANEAVMNEADAEEANSSGNEVKKNKIIEKIKEIIDAIGNAIKQAAQKVMKKIQDLLDQDKKLYNTYKSVLTTGNLEGFPGIANFKFPKAMINSDSLKDIKAAGSFSSEFNAAVQRAEERDIIDSAWEKFSSKIGEVEDAISKMADDDLYFNAAVDSWTPNDGDIKKMLGTVSNAKDTISGIKSHAAGVLSELNKLKSQAKSSKKSAKKGGDEIEVYKLTKMYDAASKTCKVFSKEFSAYTNVAVKQIAACRKAVIICGRYAMKKSKGQETSANESMIMSALGESSDIFVYEHFAY